LKTKKLELTRPFQVGELGRELGGIKIGIVVKWIQLSENRKPLIKDAELWYDIVLDGKGKQLYYVQKVDNSI